MEGGVSTMCPDDKLPCFGDNLSFEQEIGYKGHIVSIVAFSLIPIIFGYKLGIKSSSIRPFGHPDMSGQEKSH